MPTNLRTGFRYENTDVLSTAYVPTPLGTAWEGKAEFSVIQEFGKEVVDETTGKSYTQLPEPKVSEGAYGIFLPNLDLNVEIADDLVGRFSMSKTITRPSYNLIKGGTTVNGLSYKYGNLSASSGTRTG